MSDRKPCECPQGICWKQSHKPLCYDCWKAQGKPHSHENPYRRYERSYARAEASYERTWDN